MTIREAIDAIVSHGRCPACHSEWSPCSVAAGGIAAKESWEGQTGARRMGALP